MKNLKHLWILFILITSLSFAQQPTNLTDAKQAVITYYNSGQYDKDVASVINEAWKNMESVKFDSTWAFVFDIDETCVSNWQFEKKYDFGYDSLLWNNWVLSAKAPAIPQVKKFYDSLVKLNIKIIFLTGRPENQKDATIINLNNDGFIKYEKLILRKTKEPDISAQNYKTQERRILVEEQHYKLLGSIGDQWSDLEGGYVIIKVKLPNCMYFIK